VSGKTNRAHEKNPSNIVILKKVETAFVIDDFSRAYCYCSTGGGKCAEVGVWRKVT
jgi:hypothetical protein